MTKFRKVEKSPDVRGSIKQHYDMDFFYASTFIRTAYGKQSVSGVFNSLSLAEDWLRKIYLAQRVLTIKFRKRLN